MSRELDEKVARALGWQAQGGDWLHRDGRMLLHLPRYSTDYACVPEMLAHLSKDGLVVEMNAWNCGNDGKPGASALLVKDGDAMSPYVEGRHLPEALARLVVAVAEAKEAGK